MNLQYLNIFPFDNQEMLSVHLDSNVPKPVVKVGDKIKFVPGVEIDGCAKTKGIKPYFNHVILNVYEFTFRPIMKITTIKSRKDPFCMDIDYLIEFPFFTAYFSEFQLDDYKPLNLKLNQLYTGYGKFGVFCLDTFDLMPKPIREKLEHLRINARIDKILDCEICQTWRENEDTRIYAWLNETLHKTDEYSEDILYFKNFDQFKMNIAAYRNRVQEVATNEKCDLPTYCLKIR